MAPGAGQFPVGVIGPRLPELSPAVSGHRCFAFDWQTVQRPSSGPRTDRSRGSSGSARRCRVGSKRQRPG
ncbi:TPA: hypothetical protein LY251_002574 [Shigella flexneri]|nr:hypothetical protein [Shigella flexneri]